MKSRSSGKNLETIVFELADRLVKEHPYLGDVCAASKHALVHKRTLAFRHDMVKTIITDLNTKLDTIKEYYKYEVFSMLVNTYFMIDIATHDYMDFQDLTDSIRSVVQKVSKAFFDISHQDSDPLTGKEYDMLAVQLIQLIDPYITD